tara:strand:+ start:511 stop:2352 length:1842 start_codon:yes stop_codon:yes gene_type:complete
MAIDVKKRIKKARTRNYLVKDFDDFRGDVLRYARTYFSDRIQDFSEGSLGGLFLDMVSMVGDNMSFYLDHQFNELNWATAVESKNVQRHIRSAGIPIKGASPSVVDVTVLLEIPSELYEGEYRPKRSALPVVHSSSVFQSDDGVYFNLVEDIDFTEEKGDALTADIIVSTSNSDGSPASYIVSKIGQCVSGVEQIETFSVGSTHVPFRSISLSADNVTQVLEVVDSEGNEYHEVESLTQDVVYKGITNKDEDGFLVKENLEIIPAPYRFLKIMDVRTRSTKLRFGGGDAETLDDDIIPDPSELSLPLYGKKTLSRFSIDPRGLLQTHTLGIAPLNTKITVRYLYGGGRSHNVKPDSVRTIDTLRMKFYKNPSVTDAQFVRASIDITNRTSASGGDSAPTIDELRAQIPQSRQMQSRIVSKEDLLSRIYTLPSQFGRVYRAGIRQNPNNPLAVQLFIISRDIDKKLGPSPDALKKNLRTYLNEFRLISDALDVLDARVINIGIKFEIVSHIDKNKNLVVQNVIANIQDIMKIENFQIDQPILIDDITNIIINTEGVISLTNLKFVNLRGGVEDREYSDVAMNIEGSTYRRMIIGPAGSIFEMRYPEHDIIGTSL